MDEAFLKDLRGLIILLLMLLLDRWNGLRASSEMSLWGFAPCWYALTAG